MCRAVHFLLRATGQYRPQWPHALRACNMPPGPYCLAEAWVMKQTTAHAQDTEGMSLPLNQGPRCPQSSVPDPTRTLAPRRRIGIPRARNEADAHSANAARNERERDDWLGNLRAQCEMCSVQIATRAWVGGGVLVQPPPIRLARCRLRPTSGGDRTALPGIDIVQVFFEVRQQRTERIPAARTHTLGVNPLSQRELA